MVKPVEIGKLQGWVDEKGGLALSLVPSGPLAGKREMRIPIRKSKTMDEIAQTLMTHKNALKIQQYSAPWDKLREINKDSKAPNLFVVDAFDCYRKDGPTTIRLIVSAIEKSGLTVSQVPVYRTVGDGDSYETDYVVISRSNFDEGSSYSEYANKHPDVIFLLDPEHRDTNWITRITPTWRMFDFGQTFSLMGEKDLHGSGRDEPRSMTKLRDMSLTAHFAVMKSLDGLVLSRGHTYHPETTFLGYIPNEKSE